MKPKRKRMLMVGGALLVVAAGAALVLTALEDNIVFFHSPSDVLAKKVEPGRRFRIGGLVAEGSVRKGEAQQVTFDVTDGKATVRVAYKGSLPDLFREGQGVVAQGALRPDGVFAASEVLAKHDENYMPPEVAAALKKSGRWQHYKDGKPITGAPAAGTTQ